MNPSAPQRRPPAPCVEELLNITPGGRLYDGSASSPTGARTKRAGWPSLAVRDRLTAWLGGGHTDDWRPERFNAALRSAPPPTPRRPRERHHFFDLAISFCRCALYDLMSPPHLVMPRSTTQISCATWLSNRKSCEMTTRPPCVHER